MNMFRTDIYDSESKWFEGCEDGIIRLHARLQGNTICSSSYQVCYKIIEFDFLQGFVVSESWQSILFLIFRITIKTCIKLFSSERERLIFLGDDDIICIAFTFLVRQHLIGMIQKGLCANMGIFIYTGKTWVIKSLLVSKVF